jgi:hypothetical protein
VCSGPFPGVALHAFLFAFIGGGDPCGLWRLGACSSLRLRRLDGRDGSRPRSRRVGAPSAGAESVAWPPADRG